MRAKVDEWLESDRKAPRKQRHTARRIFKHLRDEMGYQGAESTVRFFVADHGKKPLKTNINVEPLTHLGRLQLQHLQLAQPLKAVAEPIAVCPMGA